MAKLLSYASESMKIQQDNSGNDQNNPLLENSGTAHVSRVNYNIFAGGLCCYS